MADDRGIAPTAGRSGRKGEAVTRGGRERTSLKRPSGHRRGSLCQFDPTRPALATTAIAVTNGPSIRGRLRTFFRLQRLHNDACPQIEGRRADRALRSGRRVKCAREHGYLRSPGCCRSETDMLRTCGFPVNSLGRSASVSSQARCFLIFRSPGLKYQKASKLFFSRLTGCHFPSTMWIPHSVLPLPRQRPARGSSPSETRVVHGWQPIEG